jgi:ketosteroid isomerase-like protein
MARTPLPPVAAVVSFVDAINHGDVDRLGSLMTDDHRLVVLDEAPLTGRAENVEAWRGYASSYPEYVIYPDRFVERDGHVALLGRTTGSHLGLPDEQEREVSVIWVAEVVDGTLAAWRIVEDTPEARARVGLSGDGG